MVEARIQDPEKLETARADRQGRINLGVEYAGRDVEFVVVESGEPDTDSVPLQQTIGNGPLADYERKGMLFVRAFGLAPRFLTEDHGAVVTDGEVDVETVAPTDVDWSQGVLVEPRNVAQFVFDEEVWDGTSFSERFTAVPVERTEDTIDDTEVYRYENDEGETSAIAEEFTAPVEPILGYDPTDELSHVRVDPEQGPAPVLFTDPESDAYIAVAPRIDE